MAVEVKKIEDKWVVVGPGGTRVVDTKKEAVQRGRGMASGFQQDLNIFRADGSLQEKVERENKNNDSGGGLGLRSIF